jgi:4-hydroxy-2-oxoglutarate aldolase
MFRGVIAPLATPFGVDGELELGAFCRNLERYLESRLSGFVVAGTTGEGLHLSDGEKVQLVRESAEILPSDRFLLAGIPAHSLREAVELADQLARFRLDGLLVTVPSYYRSRMTEEALRDYFLGLADRTPLPVYLYNIPQLTGIVLPVSVVQELAGHPKIAGMKESSGNLIYVQEVLRAVEGRGFQLLSGSAETFAFARQLGVEAAILGAACIIPDMLAKQADRADRPDGEFRDVQEKIGLLSSIVVRGLGVAGIKCAMELKGYEGLYCRRPLAPLSVAERERVRDVMEQIERR